MERFAAGGERADDLRRELGLSKEDFVAVSVGQLSKRKNQMTAIRAMAQIADPDVKYVAVGLGECEDEDRRLVGELGLEGRVILTGYREDVVPAAEDWQFPPFQMIKKGERLYGRGTADMKGGVAAMCAVLLQLSRENIRLSGTLTLVLVADEECGNLGMRHFLREKGKAAFAVIGEPTELQVAVAHRGVLRDYVRNGRCVFGAFWDTDSGNFFNEVVSVGIMHYFALVPCVVASLVTHGMRIGIRN